MDDVLSLVSSQESFFVAALLYLFLFFSIKKML